MSTTALDIKKRHRLYQVEQSPDSEEFQIVDGGTFRGIFDRSYLSGDKDNGNVLNKKNNPMIMVVGLPDGLTPRVSVIRREGWETGDPEYKFFQYQDDDVEIPVLWLF